MTNQLPSSVISLTRVFCIHQFFNWFPIGIILPIMTLFLMGKGMDLFEVGVCVAAYAGAMFLFELPTGGLADQIGRKNVYLISTGVSLLGVGAMLLAGHIYWLYIGAVFMGIAQSLSTGTIDAWFVNRFHELAPEANLQVALAKVNLWVSLGFGIGTLTGGFLPLLAPWFGWERYSPNLVGMIVTFLWVGFFTIVWIHDSPASEEHAPFWESLGNLPQIFREAFHYSWSNPSLFLLMIATCIWGVAESGIENMWQPQVKNILQSEEHSWVFGLLGTGYFFSEALGSLLVTPLCRLFHNQYHGFLMVTRLVMGSIFLVLAAQTNIWGFTFFYFFLFFHNGILTSPHQSLFHELVPPERRSTLISLESLFLSIGGMGGSLVLGWLAKHYSIAFTWQLTGILFMLSAFCYLRLPSKRSKPVKPSWESASK